MARLPCLMVCAVAGVALVGCGTGGDRDAVRDAAQGLYRAAADRDGEAACARMSPSLRQALVEDEGERCAKAVLDLDLSGRTARVVEVYANAAIVRLAGGDTVFLDDTALGWRVDALGCRPEGAGRPYDCEAEA
jgi:hypothetical protein